MARRPDEIDFEQYYEDWRHRDTLTWQIPAVTAAIGGGVIIGGHLANIPWYAQVLTFGLGAFFIATLTVMLAQNLYYQWRDEKHLEDYGRIKAAKLQSRPVPLLTKEEKPLKLSKIPWRPITCLPCLRMAKRLGSFLGLLDSPNFEGLFTRVGRVLGAKRMGSSLLLVSCFLFYAGLTGLFINVTWSCKALCIPALVFIFLPFGWFLKWLIRGVEKE